VRATRGTRSAGLETIATKASPGGAGPSATIRSVISDSIAEQRVPEDAAALPRDADEVARRRVGLADVAAVDPRVARACAVPRLYA
jgi:hypothetical protein